IRVQLWPVLFPRLICPLGMALQLVRIEIDFSQITGAVSLCLIVEMLRRGIAAFTARGHRFRSNCLSKLDYRDETVAAGAVYFLRDLVLPRPKAGQRPPKCRSETDWYARSVIVERMGQVIGQSLKPIDFAPGFFPRSEVSLEFIRGIGQRVQQLLSSERASHVLMQL